MLDRKSIFFFILLSRLMQFYYPNYIIIACNAFGRFIKAINKYYDRHFF